MIKKLILLVLFPSASLWMVFTFTPCAQAQQTLGGITGTVDDSSRAAVADTTVVLVGDQTKLTRNQKTDGTGSYTLTFSHEGFQTQNVPSILVQANRTATLNATLKIGQVNQTITVDETS